jgi:hypothetical protein
MLQLGKTVSYAVTPRAFCVIRTSMYVMFMSYSVCFVLIQSKRLGRFEWAVLWSKYVRNHPTQRLYSINTKTRHPMITIVDDHPMTAHRDSVTVGLSQCPGVVSGETDRLRPPREAVVT